MGSSTSSNKQNIKQTKINKNSISSTYNKTQNKIKEKETNHMEHYIKKTYISFPFPIKTLPSSNSIIYYDVSKNKINQLNQITKTSANLKKNILINLENLLSQSECTHLIREIESLSFNSISNEYPENYRNCQRKIVFSNQLANCLHERIIDCFDWEELRNISPFGFAKSGVWLMDSVNPCFRFSKYFKGHFFQKHLDGGHVESNDYRSVLTLMVYLNEDFQGGETVFYEEEEVDKEENAQQRESAKIKVTPKVGKGVIFNHDLLHEALALEGEKDVKKYVLRTDVMFKRFNIYNDAAVEGESKCGIEVVNKSERKSESESKSKKNNIGNSNNLNYFGSFNFDLLKNQEYVRSEKLFYECVDLQKSCNPKLSTEKYLEAQKILAQYPTFGSRRLYKLNESDFPKNKFFYKAFNSNFIFEFLQKYLFDFDLLEKNNESNNQNNYDYELKYNNKWPPLLKLNKDKLMQILNMRFVSRKFNKFFSGNFLWKQILELNYYKNADRLFGLKAQEKYPNDTRFLENFKLKALQLRKNLKVFIDLGFKNIRLLFNQPILTPNKYLNRESNFPYERFAGKIETFVNYHRGHLWNCNSGFGVSIGKKPIYFSSGGLISVNCFDDKKDLSCFHISNVMRFVSAMNNCISYTFSLPFFMFEEFEFELECENIIEDIVDNNNYSKNNIDKNYENKNICNLDINQSDRINLDDILNKNNIKNQNNQKTKAKTYKWNSEALYKKRLKKDYFERLIALKEEEKLKKVMLNTQNRIISEDISADYYKKSDFYCIEENKEIISQKLLKLANCPKPELLREINNWEDLLECLMNCICREKLFYLATGKNENAIVIFFDGEISTFVFFHKHELDFEVCFKFNEEEFKIKKAYVILLYKESIDRMLGKFSKENTEKIDVILVYEENDYEGFVKDLFGELINNGNIEFDFKSFNYDNIYQLVNEYILID